MAQWAVRKPPQVFLLYDLVAQGRQLTQVDNVLLETLENMANRASMWEASVREAFRDTGSTEDVAISVAILRKLLGQAKHIPVLLFLESKVSAALEDGGNRYCLCRGPNDGSFMVECDVCQQWYHGECVNLKVKIQKLYLTTIVIMNRTALACAGVDLFAILLSRVPLTGGRG